MLGRGPHIPETHLAQVGALAAQHGLVLLAALVEEVDALLVGRDALRGAAVLAAGAYPQVRTWVDRSTERVKSD